MSDAEFQVPVLSPKELDELLIRAKEEQWTELALAPVENNWRVYQLNRDGFSSERVYCVSERIGPEGIRVLGTLQNLDSLHLYNCSIGPEGARAIASLQNLTSLNLYNNNIGPAGARAIASLQNLTSLNLHNNGIGPEGARAIASLQNLTSLDLDYNSIGPEGARAIATLQNLTSLDLSNNGIGDEGARSIALLKNLTSLNLFGNSIAREGARVIASLQNLTSLNLFGNNIGPEGAWAIASLQNLTSLNLFGNGIGDVGARAIASFQNLITLDLSGNGIGFEGVRSVASLHGLTSLNLFGNSIGDEGARAIASLQNLTSLDLSENRIGDEGAPAITSLQNLASLNLYNNLIRDDGARSFLEAWIDSPLSNCLRHLDVRRNEGFQQLLPAELLERQDAQAILAAYRRIRSGPQKPLNEAKLLVVGNEAVGKTSLIKYLIDGQPRDPSEKKTEGTAIRERIETRDWCDKNCPVTLHVWDFGGQLMMHGTHRYFLTQRSLYLLVLEDRREDDRTYFDWLRTITDHGGDSPILIVINKCDPDKRPALELDEAALKQEFPGIVKVLRTSCDPGEKPEAQIEALRQVIVQTLADDRRMQHVRDPIPKAWLRVKQAIADQARQDRVLKHQDFIRFCAHPTGTTDPDDLVTDEHEQRGLLRLLHDLGVVVAHGMKDNASAAQREISILDPNWLTGAIYKLLNHPQIKDQDGEFARAQLPQLLDPELYPARWYEFILDMMQDSAIGLCFELPGTQVRGRDERYLIPEALSPKEREYGMFPADSLRFRVQYGYLQSGLLPRFIVQAHRNLTDQPTRWKTGVVLEAAGCWILVQANLDHHRVEITVSGPANQRRSALGIVLDDLDEVHARKFGSKPELRVPLPDDPAQDVGYSHLLQLEQRKGLDYSFLPENATRDYTVRELLEGVRREGGRFDPEGRMRDLDPRMPTIYAGDHTQIHVAGRDVRSRDYQTQVAQPFLSSTPAKSGWEWLWSWPMLSVACGVGSVFLVIGLWLIPSNEWRATVAGLVGLGIAVTLVVSSFNPVYFYRRMLGWVIPGGLLTNALGVTIDAGLLNRWGISWLRWDSSVSGWFYVAWAIVVCALAALDWKTVSKASP